MTTPDATPTAPHSHAQPVSAPEPSGSTPEAGEAARVALLEAEVAQLRRQWHQECDNFERETARAEAAEAESARLASVVAKVEALTYDWPCSDDACDGDCTGCAYAADLRDALASVGVSGSADDRREANASQAPDTATPGEATEGRAKVITLCGSTRFKDEFHSWNSRLTLDGNVILSVGVFGHGMHPYHREKYLDPKKPMLDRLHRQKIDMADEVFVIDPGGYIGDSTRAEIAYAKSLGKPVVRLSQIDPECAVCGLDNRNGTHSAMERFGNLNHAFTPAASSAGDKAGEQ